LKSKETNEELDSFSIITTEANSFMSKIHNRMPVFLKKEDEEAWLNPDNKDIEFLKSLLKPCPSNLLDAFAVSKLVNSPKNNTPDILKPIHSG
jgi:putative SOS response-associated peptidase YedK